MLDGAEVAKHNSRESCWIIVHGRAYDTTEYINCHPGGAVAMLRYAGKDATEIYDKIHAEGTIEWGLARGIYTLRGLEKGPED
jgi:L-lactate dehydrogenase (cytochrome)